MVKDFLNILVGILGLLAAMTFALCAFLFMLFVAGQFGAWLGMWEV